MTRPSGVRARRILGTLLVVAALAAGAVAHLAATTGVVLFDRAFRPDVAARALDDGRVRDRMTEQVAGSVGHALLGSDTVQALAAVGVEPGADIDAAARAVVVAPEFRASFALAVGHLREAALVRGGGPVHFDASEALPAAREALVERNPLYAEVLTSGVPLTVTLTEEAPDLVGLDSRLARIALAATIVAAAMVAAALATHPDRLGAARMASLGTIVVAAASSLVSLALPAVVDRPGSDAGPIMAGLAAAALPQFALAALALALAGLVLFASVWVWDRLHVSRSDDRRANRIGAEAFLAGDPAAPRSRAPIGTASLRSPRGIAAPPGGGPSPAERASERSLPPPDGIFSDRRALRGWSSPDLVSDPGGTATSGRGGRGARRAPGRPLDA